MALIPAATGISSLRDRYSRALYILLGIVALVLTIACANMANLLLAQSVARRKELALRLSLGAGRWQLVRQLLVESVMLSVIGALGGLVIAAWGSRALVAMLSTRIHHRGARSVDGLARVRLHRRRRRDDRAAVRRRARVSRHRR